MIHGQKLDFYFYVRSKLNVLSRQFLLESRFSDSGAATADGRL